MMKVEKVKMNNFYLSIHSGAFYFGGESKVELTKQEQIVIIGRLIIRMKRAYVTVTSVLLIL